MFILVFLLSIKISFQLEIKLNLSNTIPNITTTIKQSSLFQKLNISLPLLYSCFGTPSQCFNMTFETTYYNTFLDGTGDYFRNSFNKTHSQTFNTTNQSLFFNYQDNNLKGNFGLDNIIIYNNTQKIKQNEKFAFLLLEEKSESVNKILVDGIIGLKKNNSLTNNCKVSFLNYFNINSNFSFQFKRNKNNELEVFFLIDDKKDNNDNYTPCKNSNKNNNDIDNEWKCKITNISIDIGVSSNIPIPFNNFAYFSVINPLIELPYEIGYFILNRLYEQSENQCEIVKEGNISIFICNKNEIDITKFEKIYLYYNNNKTNPIILNPKNYFEIINDKYIFKIIQNKNINNIILGIPAFLDNTFIFDLKENMIKIKEHKENYMAYIIIIGIIALLLIIIPILIYIYENNKKEKNFNKLDDISNTNNLIEKNYSN